MSAGSGVEEELYYQVLSLLQREESIHYQEAMREIEGLKLQTWRRIIHRLKEEGKVEFPPVDLRYRLRNQYRGER